MYSNFNDKRYRFLNQDNCNFKKQKTKNISKGLYFVMQIISSLLEYIFPVQSFSSQPLSEDDLFTKKKGL